MEPPRKYHAGREPWTRAGVTKKTWLRKQREARMTPLERDAYRARTLATARSASARYKAKLRSSRPSRRATNANPVPGVVPGDDWGGKGAALKGSKRRPMAMSMPARVGWLCAKAARRSLALRAALDAGRPKDRHDPPEWHTGDLSVRSMLFFG